MTKSRSTKRALLASALALLVSVSMLVGTTFAWFTDSVTSSGNKIVAGTLDVELYMHNGTSYVDISDDTAPIFGGASSLMAQNNNANTLWEPGKTQVAYLMIKNAGNLALKYSVGLDVKNISKDLYKAMEYAVVAGAEASDVTKSTVLDYKSVNLGVQTVSETELVMNPGTEHYFALAIHMDEEAGNEYQGGEVDFDLTVLATQATVEKDSFDEQYDKDATYGLLAAGSLPVAELTAPEGISLYKADGGKVGSAVFLPGTKTDAESVSVSINETKVNSQVTIESDQSAKTYDVTVTGLADDNDKPVKVTINVGTGLTGVKLYHYGTEVTNAYYNATTGLITFESLDFSPFTVVYDEVAVEEEIKDTNVPVAVVEQIANEQIAWSGWGGFNPADLTQQLDATFLFKAPHDSTTVKECEYKDWYCDYYVSLNSDTLDTLPEGYITLGGKYGSYDWVGFDNPEVTANKEIPLLAATISKDPDAVSNWTYADVVGLVKEFKCGVGITNALKASTNKDVLNGSTFVVELRLINPADTTQFISVNTVKYTFGTGDVVFEQYN